jgi:hypothetical protein
MNTDDYDLIERIIVVGDRLVNYIDYPPDKYEAKALEDWKEATRIFRSIIEENKRNL